jgi:hypothetical protein
MYNFFKTISLNQIEFEKKLDNKYKQQKGVYFTNSLEIIDNTLDIIKIDDSIFEKKILEPSCGQGIFLLKLIYNVYIIFPNSQRLYNFINNNIFFIDIDKNMILQTIDNIKALYKYLFNKEYNGNFNSIECDFTDKKCNANLFEYHTDTILSKLYNTFDYVIGNPPYVSLYGRRDKKLNEEQRINYLHNYTQFPNYIKNGKINLVMLFLEHSLDLLKDDGRLSFIIDISFFESAYKYTRKFLLDNSTINELDINIQKFNVASGQIIIKITKSKYHPNNIVKIVDYKNNSTYQIPQINWNNNKDEYRFRYNISNINKNIIDKIYIKGEKTLLDKFPNKNLRTCTMLLDMEDKFTCTNLIENSKLNANTYPYYQGSKSLSSKYSILKYYKYFIYNKELQDNINNQLKIELREKGIKNKKRIGLGETIIYDNPKIYIRQSAKELIATIDMNKSSANNSLYVFSLRDNSIENINYLYFLVGWLNSDLITYYAQQMNIIRYSIGKQPQIKISDLYSIPILEDLEIQKIIYNKVKQIYNNQSLSVKFQQEINSIIYNFYNINTSEIDNINKQINDFR